MFQRLKPNGARKTLNQVKDEANTHPNPVGGDLDRDLELALPLQCEEWPKASAVGHPSKQGTSPLTDPRDA